MNDSRGGDLLSAYLDGEASAAERLEVEALLAGSPAAQRELDGLRQVSEMLHDLPRVSLGDDFVSQIMQQAERRTLLPLAAARPPVRSRRWAVAGLVAAAALVLIAVNFFSRPAGEQPGPEVAQAPPAAPSEPIVHHHRRPHMPLAMKSAPANSGANAVPGDRPRVVAVSPESATADLQAGQTVDVAEEVDGRVRIVKAYVIDRDAGMQTVQVVLARNAISEAGDPTAGTKAAAAVEGGMEALFITAPSEQIAAALAQLENEGVRLQPQGSIQLADLDEHSRRLFGVPQKELPAVEKRPSAGPAADRVLAGTGCQRRGRLPADRLTPAAEAPPETSGAGRLIIVVDVK